MIKWYDRIGNKIEMKLYENADNPQFEWVKGSVIEGYRYQDGIVTMKSDDGRIIWCGIESGDFRKTDESLGDFISNADRIHSMSIEELANENVYFVSEFCARDGLRYTGLDGHYYRTGAEVVEANKIWLQSEAKEES